MSRAARSIRRRTPVARQGEEWTRARCTACGLHWEGVGSIAARRALAAAQRHANRFGHIIDAQHANAK